MSGGYLSGGYLSGGICPRILQHTLNRFAACCDGSGMKINVNKAKTR